MIFLHKTHSNHKKRCKSSEKMMILSILSRIFSKFAAKVDVFALS